MIHRKGLIIFLFLLCAGWLAAPGPLLADEGMWPFNLVPKAELKARYGFEPTEAWLTHVRLSSVRFNNGGSGSFVSADGMVMTNHHVGADCMQKLSNEKTDYYRNGFWAKQRADEAKCPDLELNVLESIEDVTARVNAAVKPEMNPGDANTARRGAMADVEKECSTQTGLRCDVITLYQGGRYHLYRYKKYTDVRLVFAPEFGIAFFGGDPDNFTYPRYDLDLCLFRVYENDKHAVIKDYFKWSKNGAAENELVFVSGNPGSTSRLNTLAHLEYLRDVGFPFVLNLLEWDRSNLLKFSERGPEQTRIAKEDIFGIENSLKAIREEEVALRDPELMNKKANEEKQLRAKVEADSKMKGEFGGAWNAIAKSRQELATFSKPYSFLEGGSALESDLFQFARVLVRLAAEKQKPNPDRLREYRESNLASLQFQLFSSAPIYDDYEKHKLSSSLTFFQDQLGKDNPLVEEVLGGKSPSQLADELVSGTKLKDVEVRKSLAEGGEKAIQDSTDPMIVFAKRIDPEARKLRKRYEDNVQGVERQNYALISKAIFALKGTSIYPDATFTLRLSFGTVKGYMEKGTKISYFTAFAGAYEHASKHENKPPYEMPKSWLEKKAALQLSTPLNTVNTADIIGGNSGSPVISRNAEIVGLIFDGNIQSLALDFVYSEKEARAVAVASQGIIEALRKIYGAGTIADELEGIRK
ncbi:MAG: S46 family peptidase [Acidobacteriia bacterium]|nr:S46 family peptidase [Terriglobia bacterium]